jgi:hypothetical protein
MTFQTAVLERDKINIKDLVEKLFHHPIYEQITDEQSLRVFMQSHIFCVWDFQSLLKALQCQLTCVQVPWLPTFDPEARRLVNEIVLEEESDKVGESYLSHFELYLKAMEECGADQRPIHRFIADLRQGVSVEEALSRPEIPKGVREFVQTTMSVATSGKLHRICSAFTYGREDVIPKMFQPLAQKLAVGQSERWATFLDYLNRHIQYDGERHGPLSRVLLARICAEDSRLWREAEETARMCLEARLALWDSILVSLKGTP